MLFHFNINFEYSFHKLNNESGLRIFQMSWSGWSIVSTHDIYSANMLYCSLRAANWAFGSLLCKAAQYLCFTRCLRQKHVWAGPEWLNRWGTVSHVQCHNSLLNTCALGPRCKKISCELRIPWIGLVLTVCAECYHVLSDRGRILTIFWNVYRKYFLSWVTALISFCWCYITIFQKVGMLNFWCIVNVSAISVNSGRSKWKVVRGSGLPL